MNKRFNKKLAERYPETPLEMECAKVFSKLNTRAMRHYLESDPIAWSLENETYKNWVENLMQQTCQ